MTDYASLPEDYSFNVRDGQEASAAIAEFSRREQARSIAVPTDDAKVKDRLRELGEPIILFAEGPADRRDRLRYLLSTNPDVDHAMRDGDDEEEGDEEEYYTTGTKELLIARRKMAEYSLPRASSRIRLQKLQHQIPLSRQLNFRRKLVTSLRSYVTQGSQIAGDRPVALARYSPDSKWIATGSWAGDVSLFSASDLSKTSKLTGHQEKVGGLAWHPKSGDKGSLSDDSCHLISGGGEGHICLWSISSLHSSTPSAPLATVKGHGSRVVRTEFHPSGDYFASASFDGTWRLWDVTTQRELLLQQGHSHEVYTVAFHLDGSLLASGGLDSIGRVWDLRSGKTVMVLDGHVNSIQGLSFSGDGVVVGSASADDTVKIWDLRQIKCIYTLPAHKSLVSDIRFHQPQIQFDSKYTIKKDLSSEEEHQEQDFLLGQDSPYFATSGYDGSVNIWSTADWTLIKSLQGMDEKKVMSVDIAPDSSSICASSWDRTLRLWSKE